MPSRDEAIEALLLQDCAEGNDTQHIRFAGQHSSPGLSLQPPFDDESTTAADVAASQRSDEHQQDSGRNFSANPRLMVVVLFFLHVCEGIPSGLIGATLPVILKPTLGFSRVGLFTICFYPFSLKLLWAPVLDSVWLTRLGRRRTWLVLALVGEGVAMLVLAGVGPTVFGSIAEGSTSALLGLLLICFVTNFMSATLGCAVDGWVVSELPEQYQAAASATHEMGFMVGEFAANSALLFLRDLEYVSVAQFCRIVGFLMLGMSVALSLSLVPERSKPDLCSGPREAYRSALKLFFLPPVRRLIWVHLLARLAFEVDDTATNLRLLEKGFTTSGIAFLTTVDLPTDLLSSYLAARLCTRYTPMTVWRTAFIARLSTAIVSIVLVAVCPQDGVPWPHLALNTMNRTLSISMRTMMFVAFLTFHLQIVDPVSGSVYMTLLATAQNLGRTLPQAIIMFSIDITTTRNCASIDVAQAENYQQRISRMAIPNEAGASCTVTVDGYLIVGLGCVVVGSVLYFCYLRKEVMLLQRLPRSVWLIRSIDPGR